MNHPSRRIVSTLLSVAMLASLLFHSSSARAEDSPEGSAHAATAGFGLTLGPIALWPDLTRVRFSGRGAPLENGALNSFQATGQDLGVRAPAFVGGELSFFYVRRYFALGLTGSAAGNFASPDASAPDASLVSAKSMVMYSGAFDLSGALPLGGAALRLGSLAGVRGFAVSAANLQSTCSSIRRGSFACGATAWSDAQVFVEPRARVSYPILGPAIWIDGTIGYDIVGGGAAIGLAMRLELPWNGAIPARARAYPWESSP